MKTTLLSIAVLLGVATSGALAQKVVIDFDDLPGKPSFHGVGYPVEPQYMISTRYQSQGVVFNSGGGGIWAGALSYPISSPNLVGPTTPGPALSYHDSIEATFTLGNGPMVVDAVQIHLVLWAGPTTLEAYDENGVLLGARSDLGPGKITVLFPDRIHRVVVHGGPYVFDDFTFWNLSYPGPSGYCTAGTTSSGCRATLAGSGAASLSNTAPFTLTCTSVEGAKSGVFFYGASGRLAAPWGFNGTSWLCVKAPYQRTSPVLTSGGTAGTCTGSFTFDWNAYVAANPLKPIHQALTPGSVVNAQAWFRDPASGTGPVGAKGTALSDGLEFPVQP